MTDRTVTIKAPNFEVAEFQLIGTAPLVQHRFAEKSQRQMRERQAAGERAKKNRKREARDFDADYEAAFHRDARGRAGIPAPAFRGAMIDACRGAGFVMTRAKMSVFVLNDVVTPDGTPLVLIEGTPERSETYARNETGVVDLRVRPMWREWSVRLRVRYDADQFSAADVANLLQRAGISVGVGEGRPYSKNSAGVGWGTFRIAEEMVA